MFDGSSVLFDGSHEAGRITRGCQRFVRSGTTSGGVLIAGRTAGAAACIAKHGRRDSSASPRKPFQ
jgi:hypothetical protein